MMITYINANGESITLRQQKPYFIQRVDGTGTVKNNINTFKAPNQDGAFFISGSLDMRNITIEGTVVCATADDTYTARKHLLRVFTPKSQGLLRYRDAQIPCVVEEAGFVAGIKERIPAFFISLLCPSPFFEALDELRVELAQWMRHFSFSLEIPASGIEMGTRQPSQIMTVDNMGDVPCGCTITFKALGSVANPSLMNIDTGEIMRLRVNMTEGEELRIYTHFANKRVVKILRGTESNAFSLIDAGSTFLQLSPGRNTLRYNADTNLDLLEVSIAFREQYLGV